MTLKKPRRSTSRSKWRSLLNSSLKFTSGMAFTFLKNILPEEIIICRYFHLNLPNLFNLKLEILLIEQFAIPHYFSICPLMIFLFCNFEFKRFKNSFIFRSLYEYWIQILKSEFQFLISTKNIDSNNFSLHTIDVLYYLKFR